jgi:hypothetical protein
VSVAVMTWVFQHSQSTGNDRLVLLAIADRANDDGDDCWPSIPTLARKARCSERTVQRSIKSLAALGELAVEEGAGPHGVNRYRVLMPPPTGDNLTPPPGDNLSPRQVDAGDSGDTRGVTPVSPDTSLRPKNPPTPRDAGGDRRPHCEEHRRWRASCSACRAALDPPKQKPTWCGECDERTRLIEIDDGNPPGAVARCPRCHPLNHPTA